MSDNFPQSQSTPPPQPPSRGLPLPTVKPFWVYVLLAAIGLMFALEMLLPMLAPYIIPFLSPDYAGVRPADFSGGSTNTLVLVLLGANVRPLIYEGEVWRFFTSMFLHIGIPHLLFNSYALFIFGAEMERMYGHARFLTIYILAGLFGSLASFAFNDALISAGASGAIFGIIGMQAAYFYRHKDILGAAGRNRLINIGIIAAINIFFGLSQSGIDNWAHMGGLAAGLALGYAMCPLYEVVGQYTTDAHVVDRTSFRAQAWIPLLATLLLIGGTYLALGRG